MYLCVRCACVACVCVCVCVCLYVCVCGLTGIRIWTRVLSRFSFSSPMPPTRSLARYAVHAVVVVVVAVVLVVFGVACWWLCVCMCVCFFLRAKRVDNRHKRERKHRITEFQQKYTHTCTNTNRHAALMTSHITQQHSATTVQNTAQREVSPGNAHHHITLHQRLWLFVFAFG